MLLIEFNQEYLIEFLNVGILTRVNLPHYYLVEDVKDKFGLVEK